MPSITLVDPKTKEAADGTVYKIDTSGVKPPVTLLGSPFERMYSLDGLIEWNDSLYSISINFDYYNGQDAIKKKLGKLIGSIGSGDYKEGIYEIKGISINKSIALKDNQVFIQYDLVRSEKITFNDQQYIIRLNRDEDYGVRGEQIGYTSENEEVDLIIGVNSSKAIIVVINSEDGNCDGTYVAYKK